VIVWGIGLILGSLLLHFEKNLDFWLVSFFYHDGAWAIKDEVRSLYFLFYDFPRHFVVVSFLCALGPLILRILRRGKNPTPTAKKKFPPEIILFLGMLIFVGIVDALKKVTGQACPNAFDVFGGTIPRSAFFSPGTRCFPGGHSTTGFVWILLGASQVRRFGRFASPTFWIILGTVFGWTTGMYQTLRGLHFFSDTIASFGLSLVFYGVLEKILYRLEKKNSL
jgi:membrane-associated PAP2 superfamily phosphatase